MKSVLFLFGFTLASGFVCFWPSVSCACLDCAVCAVSAAPSSWVSGPYPEFFMGGGGVGGFPKTTFSFINVIAYIGIYKMKCLKMLF